MSNQAALEDIPLDLRGEDGADAEKTCQPGVDNRDASARMLGLYPAAFPDAKPVSGTCRHFRNQVPSEIADELRDNDPEPCHICDATPHRRNRGIRPVADYSPI